MGEGILIYGLGGRKRRYTRDLQSFADKILARGRTNGSMYIFGKVSKAYLLYLSRKGMKIKSDKAAITDRTILKYRYHPKKDKGATVNVNRFRVMEAVVKRPKHVYIDTNRSSKILK